MTQTGDSGNYDLRLILHSPPLITKCYCDLRDIEFDLENDQTRCLKGLDYDASNAAPPSVLRVTQIFDKPQFVVDGADAVDIIQGSLGDCWLLSGLATMSTSKGLIEKLCVSVNYFLLHVANLRYYFY